MCRHRGVNYGGNHITIYIHITRCTVQSTTVHLKLTQYHVNDVLRIRKKRAREERRGKERKVRFPGRMMDYILSNLKSLFEL